MHASIRVQILWLIQAIILTRGGGFEIRNRSHAISIIDLLSRSETYIIVAFFLMKQNLVIGCFNCGSYILKCQCKEKKSWCNPGLSKSQQYTDIPNDRSNSVAIIENYKRNSSLGKIN